MASSNPFWFGYYPGDKPVKKYQPKIFPGPGLDFSRVTPEQLPMALDAYLDKAAAGIANTMELPKWLWDQAIDDWKKSFTAKVVGYTPAGTSSYEFEGAETADIPGVNLSLNLYDLVKNPQATLSTFVDKAIAGVDPLRRGEFWTDLDTVLTNKLYEDLAKGEGGKFLQWARSTSNEKDINVAKQGIYADRDVYTLDTAPVPPVVPLPGLADKQKEIDVYAKVGESFSAFVKNRKSTADRGKSYSTLQESFIKAAATELEQKKVQIAKGIVSTAEAGIAARYINTFEDEAKLVGALGKFTEAHTGRASIGTDLATDAVKGAVWNSSAFNNLETGSKKLRARIEEVDKAIAQHRARVERIASMAGTGGPTLQEKARYRERLDDFNKRIKPVETLLDKSEALCKRIDKLTNDVRANKGTIGRGELESLIREQKAIVTQLQHGRYGSGVYNQYLMSTTREYFDRDSMFRSNYFNDPNNAVMSQGFSSLDPLYRFSKGQYFGNEGGDLIEAIVTGEAIKRRYWIGKWKGKVQAFTPGYWTEKALTRVDYFGLNYNPKAKKWLNPDDRTVAGRLIRPFMKTHRFGASFNVSYTDSSGSTYKFRSRGKFEGGAYLKDLSNEWKRAQKGWLVSSVSYGAQIPGIREHQVKGFISLINGDSSSSGYQFHFAQSHTDVLKAGANFKKKLLRNNRKLAKSLGLELDISGNIIYNEKNEAILGTFFDKLNDMANKPGVSPFDTYVGALNFLSAKLSQLQALEAAIAKPIIMLYVKAREAIKAFIGKMVRMAMDKIFAGVITGATGGISLFLYKTIGPLVERVVNATLNRFMKYFGDGMGRALRAMLRGDINEAFESLAEAAAKMIAWIMACGCIICAIPIFLILLIFIPIMASVSPIDKSKSADTAVSGGGGGVLPPIIIPPTTSKRFFKEGCNKTPICGSFRDGYGCHGINSYWANQYSDPDMWCSYNIPINGIHNGETRGTDQHAYGDPRGIECSIGRPTPPLTFSNTHPFYGYAADYSPVNSPDCSGAGGSIVYVPDIGDGITRWMVTTSRPVSVANRGWMSILRNQDGSATYTMALLHLDRDTGEGRTYNVGEALGALYSRAGWTPHIHAELKRGTAILEPETLLNP